MSSLISYIAVLAETTGPGVLYAPTCPGISLSYLLGTPPTSGFYVKARPLTAGGHRAVGPTALTTMFFSLLNVIWMVIAVEGYRKRSYIPVAFVAVWHLAASYFVRGPSALPRRTKD